MLFKIIVTAQQQPQANKKNPPKLQLGIQRSFSRTTLDQKVKVAVDNVIMFL